jgi:hypothetical protein
MKRRYAAVDPELQRAIASEYVPGVGGVGVRTLAAGHGLSLSTVRNILARNARHGDPVQPRGHKQRKLSDDDAATLEATLDADPLATNRDLAHAVDDAIAERTVSDYLARAAPPFTTKVIQDQEPEETTDDWKAEARAWVRHVKDIPLGTRVYADESPIYANEAKRTGRSRRGQPIFRPRPRYAKKYTLHMFAKRSGVVHWELAAANADTDEVERVAAAAAPELKSGDVLIWDRLGRSGRSKHPTAQHYSPTAVGEFTERGVKVEYLPPKGKYFNPLELLFGDLKSHYIRPKYPRNGKVMSFDTLHSLIDEYVNDHSAAALPGFFTKRANGASAFVNKII